MALHYQKVNELEFALQLIRKIAAADPRTTESIATTLIEEIASQYDWEAYHANYAQKVEFYAKLRAPLSGASSVATIYRDATGGTRTPQQSIMRTAQVAVQSGVTEQALRGMVDLSEHWNDLPHLDSHEAELTDAFLNRQLAVIGSITMPRVPGPKALANALAVASLAG